MDKQRAHTSIPIYTRSPPVVHTACGSPSASLAPKLITTNRSATLSSACTTCSIHDQADAARAYLADEIYQREGLVVGEASGDLVEQQQLGPSGKRARQLESLAIQQGQRPGQRVGAFLETRSLKYVTHTE